MSLERTTIFSTTTGASPADRTSPAPRARLDGGIPFEIKDSSATLPRASTGAVTGLGRKAVRFPTVVHDQEAALVEAVLTHGQEDVEFSIVVRHTAASAKGASKKPCNYARLSLSVGTCRVITARWFPSDSRYMSVIPRFTPRFFLNARARA